MSKTSRRTFLIASGAAAAGALSSRISSSAQAKQTSVPSYLKGYESQYASEARAAAIEWFRNAKFGLFMHYGLYSLLGRHEWVQFREKIPVAEYAKLKDKFTAEKFDADFITDLAAKAEMKYINITTRHHDSFCLFKTAQTDFNSLNSPAKRDLVGELAKACRNKGLGLFFYYSHGRDWRHPHAPQGKSWGRSARPAYKTRPDRYAKDEEHDVSKYVDFMTAQIKELLTQYGPIAGIWLDGIGTSRLNKSVWRAQALYDMIHAAQPQVLVSYKQGFLGTEDFFAPERHGTPQTAGKPLEICDTLQPKGWGYIKADDRKHKTPDQVMKMLAGAAHQKANLLLNTGPMPDGSIHREDVRTLTEVGRRLRQKGFPKSQEPPARRKQPSKKKKQ
ncbi:MAG: alpha-L-fucosidase [Phycisphaerae bacterium]|nr:alpha-L-fucosidase [Phycisphaerae bacterium]